VRGRWDPVNDAIERALSGITLADMREAAIPAIFRVPAAVTTGSADVRRA